MLIDGTFLGCLPESSVTTINYTRRYRRRSHRRVTSGLYLHKDVGHAFILHEKETQKKLYSLYNIFMSLFQKGQELPTANIRHKFLEAII